MTKDYEMLVNRVQRHQHSDTYCLRPLPSGDKYCRFSFPKGLAGYTMTKSAEGKDMLKKLNHECKKGAEFPDNSLVLMRNHPYIVEHVPEILQIWRGK